MIQTNLMQHARAIVIDGLAGELAIRRESKDAAQGELDGPAGCGKTSPGSGLRAADQHLEHDRLICNDAIAYVDPQVGECRQQVAIVLLDGCTAIVPLTPGAVGIFRFIPKRAHDADEIVSVLVTNVLLDDSEASPSQFTQRIHSRSQIRLKK